MSAHYGELGDLLAKLNCHFNCIGISETRSLVDGEAVPVSLEQKHDFPIHGYEKFFTPTESSAGGVSLYISESLSYKPRDDLSRSCYLSENLESIFVEIIIPNKANVIVGTIYRHQIGRAHV